MRDLAQLGKKYRTSFVMAIKSFPSMKVAELAAQELSVNTPMNKNSAFCVIAGMKTLHTF